MTLSRLFSTLVLLMAFAEPSMALTRSEAAKVRYATQPKTRGMHSPIKVSAASKAALVTAPSRRSVAAKERYRTQPQTRGMHSPGRQTANSDSATQSPAQAAPPQPNPARRTAVAKADGPAPFATIAANEPALPPVKRGVFSRVAAAIGGLLNGTFSKSEHFKKYEGYIKGAAEKGNLVGAATALNGDFKPKGIRERWALHRLRGKVLDQAVMSMKTSSALGDIGGMAQARGGLEIMRKKAGWLNRRYIDTTEEIGVARTVKNAIAASKLGDFQGALQQLDYLKQTVGPAHWQVVRANKQIYSDAMRSAKRNAGKSVSMTQHALEAAQLAAHDGSIRFDEGKADKLTLKAIRGAGREIEKLYYEGDTKGAVQMMKAVEEARKGNPKAQPGFLERRREQALLAHGLQAAKDKSALDEQRQKRHGEEMKRQREAREAEARTRQQLAASGEPISARTQTVTIPQPPAVLAQNPGLVVEPIEPSSQPASQPANGQTAPQSKKKHDKLGSITAKVPGTSGQARVAGSGSAYGDARAELRRRGPAASPMARQLIGHNLN